MTTMTPVQAPFDADAMLMYGWVADAERRVTFVSNSLRRWIRAHRPVTPDANRLLEQITSGTGQVMLSDLLRTLLDPATEGGTPELIEQYTQKLVERLAERKTPEVPMTERAGDYTIRLQYHQPEGDERPLIGARFVRDSATLMASRWNGERVDIVVVAVVEKQDGWWRVKGFQGQLQEAWLRVATKVTDGNRAGGIALMARNLSHNIGSHALYWIADEGDADQKRFLNYLQVRMELLAGFATSMPLSPTTANVGEVVRRFTGMKLLLNNICRSESVEDIQIKYEGKENLEAVFFGGEVGIHAFYSILENCIRDSSKFAPRDEEWAQSMVMHIDAQQVDGFIQIDVYDDARNYAKHGPTIADSLRRIRISDARGRLIPESWGIKERFVCAAMLRGYRPEEFPLQETGTDETPSIGESRFDLRRVLAMEDVNGNCSWRFYLPCRAADVLLVTDQPPANAPKEVLVQTFKMFEKAAQSPAGITSPFVVLDHLPAGEHDQSLEARLPARTYVRGDAGGSRFLRIDAPIESLSPRLLLERSVTAVRDRPLLLILAVGDFEENGELSIGKQYEDLPLIVVADLQLRSEVARLRNEGRTEDFIVFKRHPHEDELEFLRSANGLGVEHYETYESNPVLTAAVRNTGPDRLRECYRLLEAALTRILIIDERLDLTLDARPDCMKRQQLLLKGIELRGSEFAGHATREDAVKVADLPSWGSGFDFVVLHRGVVDKLITDQRFGPVTTAEVVDRLESSGARVIIHSGRMGLGDMPSRTKFLSLANVTTWIDNGYSKLQIVEELFNLRRV